MTMRKQEPKLKWYKRKMPQHGLYIYIYAYMAAKVLKCMFIWKGCMVNASIIFLCLSDNTDQQK